MMSDKEKKQIVAEVNILKDLSAVKNIPIVRYVDRIVDPDNSKLFIVMEHCNKGDLGQLIKDMKG